MFLVLTLTVIICLASGLSSRESYRWFPIVTSCLGYAWFLGSLILLVNRSIIKKGRDVEKSPQADLLISTASAPAPVPEVESESIYENANELFQKTQL